MELGGGLGALTLEARPAPRPGPGEVLVKMRAVSVNARELSILVEGWYPLPVKPHVVAASDGCGEVVELGPGVARAAVGDRVMASIFPRWQDGPFRPEVAAQLSGSLDGMLTELAVLPEEALVPVPPHLSWEEGAALPCAGVTAWNALTGGKRLVAGETVLAQGTGGVSLLTVQLARAAGARVVVTTSRPARAAALRELGAHEVIDAASAPDWPVAVRRLTGGAGADHVIEVGGPGTLERSARSLAFGGELAWVGSFTRGAPPPDLSALRGVAGSLRCIAAGSRAQLLAMARAVAVAGLRPAVARVFAFEEAPAAFAFHAAGEALGKTVIRVS
jgi:NADPH:quinone reductase-like Zn-dependent oxidoreductase